MLLSSIPALAKGKGPCGENYSDDENQATLPSYEVPHHTDKLFVASSGPGFGLPCRFPSSGPIQCQLPIDRVVGNRNALVSSGLLDAYATLTICAWDVDMGELDAVSF